MPSVLVPTAADPTASDIIRGALELCQVIGSDETVSPEDSALCLRALNGILKELPIHGISWPKVSSANTALAWSVTTPDAVTVPTDFFGVPVLRFTNAAGTLSPLGPLTKVKYEALDATATGAYPEFFYLAPNNAVYLWPVPTQDPGLVLTYQAVVNDLSLTATPDVQQAFWHGLQFWLAEEVKLKFNVTGALSQEIEKKFMQKRAMMQQWSVEMAPIDMTVAE
jgi:hypothetical protein